MIWEFGKIPIEIFIAITVVLLIELPLAWKLAGSLNNLIEWIKEHETD